jgi:membrane associated rhomboid family serine protease
MPGPAPALLLEVLKACERSAPEPLHPAAFAAYSGLDRALLDQALDHLRCRGLVRLTDWAQSQGQGYALSSDGEMVLRNPDLLNHSERLEFSNPRSEPTPTGVERGPGVEASELTLGHGETIGRAIRQAARAEPRAAVVCRTLLVINVVLFAVAIYRAAQAGVRLEDSIGVSAANPALNAVRAELGALYPAELAASGQWWRLVAYAFVHAGLLDLALCMYLLFSVGRVGENLLGRVRFLFLYLIGALSGGCAALLTMTPALGAMGAVCGLLPFWALFGLLNRGSPPTGRAAGGMGSVFTILIMLAVLNFVPGGNWFIPLGGALGGLLALGPLVYHRFGSGWQVALGLAGMIGVLVILVSAIVYAQSSLPESIRVKRDLLPPYRDAEDKAATIFNEQAVPLLRNWTKDIDATRLAEARIAFHAAGQQLEDAVLVFDKAGAFQEKKVTRAVQQARGYLDAWSNFYSLFSKIIEPPPPWPREQYRALAEQIKVIDQARKPLVNSSLLPAAYSEK